MTAKEPCAKYGQGLWVTFVRCLNLTSERKASSMNANTSKKVKPMTNLSVIQKTKQWIVDEEGFRPKPYQCTMGVWTFGHGLTKITEKQSLRIVEDNIEELSNMVINKLMNEGISLDMFRVCILVDMAYQLGFEGMCKFKKMFKALKKYDYEEAAKEMLDSNWHKQTKQRCELQARRMRQGHD